MSKSNAFETSWLQLTFNGTAITNLATNTTSSPSTSLWVSLHSTDPGEAGGQNTNETTYTNYVRIAVARTTSGWEVSGNSVSPAANIDFAASTESTDAIMFFGVGTASSSGSTGYLMYSGTVTPNITISNGVTPRLTTASAITED